MTTRTLIAVCAIGVASIASLTPRHALAQDASGAVEALFAEGKRLKEEGKYAEACPKFLASYNLDKRNGTLLNLADCYEKNGQTASAWARFGEARNIALRAEQTERAKFATEHAAALAPKLSTLTIRVQSATPTLTVKLDGAATDPAAFGVALFVDPGTHKVEATAPGKKPWLAEVSIGKVADKQSIVVPELEDAPAPGTTAPANGAASPPPNTPLTSDTPHGDSRFSTRAVVGLGVAAVGVVGLGVGTVFGVRALGKNSDSNAFCGQNGRGANDCTAPGFALRNDATSAATMSTIFLIGGGVVTAAGAVLFITAPSEHKPTVSFDGTSVRVGARF